jgi:peptide/nickel transport system ATP-binding protein/oligopeptide transport system ATP-binding protein
MAEGAGVLLDVHDLRVQFAAKRPVHAVRGLSYSIAPGEALGLVGESGSGKSVSALALLGLLPKRTARVSGTSAYFDGVDLLQVGDRTLETIRGRRIGIVFQDPLASLNPVLTIGEQLSEPLRRHRGLRGRAARTRSIELLELVGIPGAPRRISDYPHQFSGGMRQRAMIAMALSCEPALLIADEPTTALDVTIRRRSWTCCAACGPSWAWRSC